MLGTSLVDRRETRLAGDALGRKLLVGRHRTCEIKVERQDAEFFSLMENHVCTLYIRCPYNS